MQKLLFIVLLAAVIGCGTTGQNLNSNAETGIPFDGLVKRLAVLPFMPQKDVEAFEASQLLVKRLGELNRFVVFGPRVSAAAAKETGNSCKVLNSPSCALGMADMLGVSAMLLVSIDELDTIKGRAALQVLVFCSDTGMLCSTVRSSVEAKKPLEAAVNDMLPRLLRILSKRVSWWTRIEKVFANDEFIIGAGSKDGLKQGNLLVVRSIGSLITNPDSGEVLRRDKGVEKATVEVVEVISEHRARVRIIKGGGVVVGDLVFSADVYD